MKLTFLTAALVASASMAAADITIITPWNSTVWTAGGHGNITWTATGADASLKCDIQLMNGDAKNSNMVASVTNPSTPVPCSDQAYDIYPLNDFASGDYWVRVGQIATNKWAYSGVFKFQGNGTARPYSVVSGASPAPIAASGKPSAKASGSGSAAAAQSSGADDEGAAGHLSAQGKTMAAVAGGALVAAMALVL